MGIIECNNIITKSAIIAKIMLIYKLSRTRTIKIDRLIVETINRIYSLPNFNSIY